MMKTKMPLALLTFSGIALGDGLPIPGTTHFLEFPNALPGKILKIHKAFDASTGRVSLVANLPDVADVADILRLEAAESLARRQVKGNLSESLFERLPRLGYHEHVRIAVRVRTNPHPFLDKTRHSEGQLIANSLAILSQPPVARPQAVLALHGLPIQEQRGDDIAIALASRGNLEALKKDPDVAAVWEDVEEEPLSAELSDLASSGYNPGGVPSGSGYGVKAATFERGLTSSFLSCIGVTPAAYDVFSLGAGNETVKRHSQATFTTLAASTPSASLYHRNSLTYNTTNDVNYLVNNGIQTVSMSMTRGGSSAERATYSEFLSMDNMAYMYPYPVFVTSAGNLGYDYEVNWQCYNCLSVGNVRHTGDSYYEMADCTQTRNPPPRYGGCISGSGSNCAGDREMPHVVAPGIPSSGSNFATTCLEGSGGVACGTSFSAPVANGMAANVIAADSRLSSWPEKVRATLILTAQNVESGNWTTSTDERDGTGTVSGSEAVAFATGHTYVIPGSPACVSGMGATSFYASDFYSNHRFQFLVPNPKPSGRHLRVVLTWDSNPNVSNGTNDLSDLDLIVQKNGGAAYSSSWDSNVEVVDIAAADLTAGNSYYIDISPYANRIPSGSSFFYYAIGWTWVKDHAP